MSRPSRLARRSIRMALAVAELLVRLTKVGLMIQVNAGPLRSL